MKVALLMQDTRVLYGAEWATVRLLRALRGAGVDACPWLLREERLDAAGDAPSPLADAFAAVASPRFFPVAGRFSRDLARRLAVAAAEDGIQLLHSTGYKADLHAVLAARLAPALPVVSTVHGWLFRRFALKERFYRRVNLWALRRMARVVVLSSFYEELLRRDGFSPSQLVRIPTGLDPDEFASAAAGDALWNDASAPFVFGMLGRLSDEKRHALFLRAVAILAGRTRTAPRSWRVVVAGDGPLRPALERLAGRLGIDDRVEWTGPVPSREFFSRVHVLVQPSRIENLPMSILEAMAWQRPTLATAAGGIPDLVADRLTGRLLPPTPNAFADALSECLANPGVPRQWGRAARARLAANFSPSAMLRSHLALYNTLANPFP